MKKLSLITLLIFLVGCAYNPKESDTYKMYWGKRCTQDGKIYSYFWLHTVYGDDQVKKTWCK